MSKYKVFMLILVTIVLNGLLLPSSKTSAQDSTAQDSMLAGYIAAPAIKASVFLDKKEVPMNRSVLFTIRINWEGDTQRYEIEDFGNPTVHNLVLDSSATLNRVAEIGGIQQKIIEYEFYLRPSSMGMGYVDNVTIWYRDVITDVREKLTTNRLEVKVLEPVPEPGDTSWIWKIALIFVFLLVGGYGIYYFYNKTIARRKAEEAAQLVVPLEDGYLEQLRTSFDLNSADLDIKEGFSTLSRLLRRYLFDCYDSVSLELTTDDVLLELQEKNAPDDLVRDCREILSTCDLAKFSGVCNKPDLDRVFTQIEAIFLRNRADRSARNGKKSVN